MTLQVPRRAPAGGVSLCGERASINPSSWPQEWGSARKTKGNAEDAPGDKKGGSGAPAGNFPGRRLGVLGLAPKRHRCFPGETLVIRIILQR